MNSREKGVRGELECSRFLKEFGFEARRGQQFAGGGDSPDVIHTIPNMHVEVKRVEALSLYPALEQAERDRKETERPVVFHRRNHKDWVVVLYAEDFLGLIGGKRASNNT